MYWNPDPVAFTIPLLNLPIFIYGICFVLGFILGYYVMLKLLEENNNTLSKETARDLLDKLTWFVVLGTIVGARLGHVFFYDWDYYKDHLLEILNTREGGLSSHGGTIGILLALPLFYYLFFKPTYKKSFLSLLDMLVIPTCIAGFFIRIGNFFNQEIIGSETDLPWGVVFGKLQDFPLIARHPSQLYEALCYLILFFFLLFLWKKPFIRAKEGLITALFFILLFGSRFFVEFTKEVQHSIIDQSTLQAGQWLSLPFIFLGGLLLIYTLFKKK